ncbi:MAG: tetratricopeptide repeat protein [Candidatus Methylacidiphilales bacterium]|nr:tetratricopeptide repeat protein [Candidatus Methylacidiphilales bacterium]
MNYGFVVWDDGINIYENPFFLSEPLANLAFFWKQAYHKLYIPLTYSMWGLVSWVSLFLTGRLHPSVFHVLNVGFHVANALLVYALIRQWRPGLSRTCSCLASLVFLLHPMQVEPVAWITGFKDVFSTFWCLLALACYLKSADSPSRPWFAASLVFFMAALLAKPSHVFLAGVVFLVEGQKAGWKWDGRRALRICCFGLMALLAVLWTRNAQQVAEGMRAAPWHLRPVVALDAATLYFWKTVYPNPIAIDYGRSPVRVLTDMWTPILVALPLVLTWVIVRFRGAWRLPVSGLVFWMLAMLPSLGLMPFYFQNISTVADRYQYAALAGLCLVWGELLDRTRHRVARLAGVAVAVALGILACAALPRWKDSGALFLHTLQHNPESWLGHVNYGSYLAEKHQEEGALHHYQEALRINPHFFGIRMALGQQLLRLDRKEEGLAQLQAAAVMDPLNAVVRMNLAIAWVRMEKPELARAEFRKALELQPDYYECWLNMGQLLVLQKNFPGAEHAFQQALRIKPGDAEASDRLAQLYWDRADVQGAWDWSHKALASNSRLLSPRVRLASIMFRRGDQEGAVNMLRTALSFHPEAPEVLNNLAWYLSVKKRTAGSDNSEAISLARRAAIGSRASDPDFLETLAVSLAAGGRYEEALEAISRAMVALPDDPASADRRREFESKKKLFNARSPYLIP